MTRQRSLRRPLAFALGDLLLLSMVPHGAYCQESDTADLEKSTIEGIEGT